MVHSRRFQQYGAWDCGNVVVGFSSIYLDSWAKSHLKWHEKGILKCSNAPVKKKKFCIHIRKQNLQCSFLNLYRINPRITAALWQILCSLLCIRFTVTRRNHNLIKVHFMGYYPPENEERASGVLGLMWPQLSFFLKFKCLLAMEKIQGGRDF